MAPGVLLEPYMSQGGQGVVETPIVSKGLTMKTPRASMAMRWALDSGHLKFTLLAQLHFILSANTPKKILGPLPLTNILDPLLMYSHKY